MNDSRSIESWRIVSVWPSVAEDHLLVGDEPRQAHGVDRRLGAAARLGHQPRGERRGAAGRVELAVVVQLDDLGLRHVPRGLGGEAHHQHRADREVGRDEHVGACGSRSAPCASRSGAEVEAGGADHDVHPGAHAGAARSRARCRLREVDDHLARRGSTSASVMPSSGSARPTSSMSSAPSTAAQTRLPHAPGRAGDRDADHAGATASSASASGSSAARKRAPRRGRSPADRQPLGREQLAGELAHVVERDGVDAARSISSTERIGSSRSSERRGGSCARRWTPARAPSRPLTFSRERVELLRARPGSATKRSQLGGEHRHRLARGSPGACRRTGRPRRCGRAGWRRRTPSRPGRGARAPPGTAARRRSPPSTLSSTRSAKRRSSSRAIPRPPRQTWYCSVSLRRKRTRRSNARLGGGSARCARAGAVAGRRRARLADHRHQLLVLDRAGRGDHDVARAR